MCVRFEKNDFKKFTTDEVFNNIVDINTIVELLLNARRKYRKNPAVCKLDGTIAKYSELLNDISKVATYFKTRHIRGQNIGVYCSNGYAFEVISLGIMASGNVACLLPITFGSGLVDQYCHLLDINNVLVDNEILSHKGVVDFDYLMRLDPLLNPFDNDINPNDSAAILLTGGTTGQPKGAVLSHKNLLAGTINGVWGIANPFNQIYYCILPLTHSFGFIRNMLTSFYTGSLIYYNTNKKFIFTDLASYKPTTLVIVPALAELFLNLVKGVGPQVLGGNVKTIVTGAANVPPYLGNGFKQFNIDFCPGYGLTECSNIVSGCHYSELKPDTVGTIFPGQEGKIVDGELWIRGNTVFKGYYNNPKETANVMENGWFKTGDLAEFDKDGYLYILGRKKEIIVLPSGENIYPAKIEAQINKLDLIQDSLIYDSKNSFGNTEIVCEVTLRPAVIKSLNCSQEQLVEMLQQHIAKVNDMFQKFEHINRVVVRDKDFERSPAMKIIRKKS